MQHPAPHDSLNLRYAARKRYPIPPGQNLDDVDRFKLPKRVPCAWTMPEMDRLIEASRLESGRYFGVAAGKWWPALLLTLFDTGLRRAAAFEIRFEEIDFTSGFLRVPAERMKNDCEQYFRLHPQTLEAILETLPPRRAKVFPWPFKHRDCHGDRLRGILKRAGLPHSRLDLFHKIRRTTASHLAKMIGRTAAIRQLGHKDDTTINRYIDPRFTADHDLSSHLPRPDWKEPARIEIEVTGPAPSADALESRKLVVNSLDVSELGVDLFATLGEKERLTPEDIKAAIKALGLNHVDLAHEIGMSVQWVCTALSGRKPMGEAMEERIRVALGLTYDRPNDRRKKWGATPATVLIHDKPMPRPLREPNPDPKGIQQ